VLPGHGESAVGVSRRGSGNTCASANPCPDARAVRREAEAARRSPPASSAAVLGRGRSGKPEARLRRLMVRAPLGSQPTNHAASAPPAAATKCSYRCGEITPTIYVLDGKLHSNNFGYSRPVVAQAQTNRFRRCLRLLLAVMALSALVACAGQAGRASSERHAVLLSIDGLRPDFYLDETWVAPELRALLRAGSHALAAEGVFPTVTYPNHATIVTGVRPARHGVLSNTIPTSAGTRGRWYEEASDLRAAPIWEWARAAGLTTAAVSCPVTAGARIDLLVPERDSYTQKNPLDRLYADSTAGIFERLGVTPRPEMFKDVVQWDAFLAETASAMIRQARPNLLLLHLVQTDFF